MKASVLCVQTNRVVRESLQVRLPHHYRTTFVATGFDAIFALNHTEFHAYVLDFFLPDWTGVSLCREIRKRDEHAPVCFYSVVSRPDARRRVLLAGADAFFGKPLDPAVLVKRVDHLLAPDRHSLQAAQARAVSTRR